MLLKNGRIRINDTLVKKDILIEGSKIVRIEDHIEGEGINLNNAYICPGLTDLHVHFREPGNTDKETIKTGSLASAKGGYTTVFLMPNLNPCPDSEEHLKVEEDIIKKDSIIKSIPYCSVSVNEKGLELSDIEKLRNHTRYFSDDGVGINNIELLDNALNLIKKYDLFIASHAEDNVYKTLPEGEFLAVKREIEEVKKYNCAYHFCHMSTKESFEYIKKAQEEGYSITCEVTPHHLFLNENMIKGNPNYKMNPPLRSEEDRLATLNALLSGVANIVSTDHAPHTKEEKERPYDKAPNGIIGIETSAPLVYTNLVKTGLISFKRFEDIMSNNALKLARLKVNEISVGSVANLCVLDIDHEHTYTEEEILSKGHNCPYIGMKLYGFNILTIYQGNIVYKR